MNTIKLLDLREGVLPDKAIKVMLNRGSIINSSEKYIQPGSIDVVPDLNHIYELKYFCLPRGDETVDKLITYLRNQRALINVKGTQLLPGKRYLIKLKECLYQNPFFGRMNPKSSPGRLFIHSRLVSDRNPSFDEVQEGYSGPLWMLVIPKFIPIDLDEYEPISQMRFFNGNARLGRKDLLRELGRLKTIVRPYCGKDLFQEEQIKIIGNNIGGIALKVDLGADIVCFKTKKTSEALSIAKRDINWKNYYIPVYNDELNKNGLALEDGTGYLFGSIESVAIPEFLCAEVVPISDRLGEFRSHFAGFIDSAFGTDATFGNTITLEVAVYEPGIYIRNGQTMAELQFEYMAESLDQGYKGNYTIQERGPRLPKYFEQSRKSFIR